MKKFTPDIEAAADRLFELAGFPDRSAPTPDAQEAALGIAAKQDDEARQEISEIRWGLSAVRRARSQ